MTGNQLILFEPGVPKEVYCWSKADLYQKGGWTIGKKINLLLPFFPFFLHNTGKFNHLYYNILTVQESRHKSEEELLEYY